MLSGGIVFAACQTDPSNACGNMTMAGAPGGCAGAGGNSGGASGISGQDPIQGCPIAAVKTIADVESMILKPTCGKTSACHRGPAFGDMTAADFWKKLRGKSTLSCEPDKFIDVDDPAKSLVLVRLKPSPRCPTSGAALDPMPPPTDGGRLTPDEVSCVEAYINAVAR